MPIATPPADFKVKIAIDRGGTFCDCVAILPDQCFLVKLLSVDPAHYSDAPTEGIRRIMERVTGQAIPRGTLIDTSRIEWIRMGTTVATNALLERKGSKHALLITRGFADLLSIGNQARPKLFDLHIKKPEILYDRVVEVQERVALVHNSEDPGLGEIVKGLSGDLIRIVEPLNVEQSRRDLLELYEEGYRSVAICLVHSYTFQQHEHLLASLAQEIGFEHVSVSSQLQSMIKIVNRGTSATADAYLTPEIKRYIAGFAKGFKGHFEDPDGTRVAFMQSDGSLADFKSFSGLKAILSGPAGGVVGYAKTCFDAEEGSPVVGFDMGGTSTDVSRFGGRMEHVFETQTAGVTIQSPQLDINTVAAGGGSMLFFRGGLFVVGPESASAHPGPACYRKGGPLTVTDANLLLGRLHVESFPAIFGPDENEPLDIKIVRTKFEELAVEINKASDVQLTVEEIACGFLRVANESMARPIRALTEGRGYSTSAHNLSCFGGAGGQHATSIASALGIHTVLVHKYSSVLSAYGMALSELGVDETEPSVEILTADSLPRLQTRLNLLKSRASERLIDQGVKVEQIRYETYLNLRYEGTDTALMIAAPQHGDFHQAFVDQHRREFGFVLPNNRAIVDDLRVRAAGEERNLGGASIKSWSAELKSTQKIPVESSLSSASIQTYFESCASYLSTSLYRLDILSPGTVIQGPAIILDSTQTLVVHPSNIATILADFVHIDVGLGPKRKLTANVIDPIQLSIFGHRFMGIAEEMGRILQKTSVSLQMKERLDFSCAIFSEDGALVANAPHVPVHLGSMGYAVKYQADLLKGKMRPGDVIVSNHPEAGGTHLPDITVICPVWNGEPGSEEIAFFACARGHHTDIGGLAGNSMSPDSTELWQEGALIHSDFLIRDGEFNLKAIEEYLSAPGRFPGVSPARRPQDNISDLKAQCAACTTGALQINALFDEYGKDVVQFYMKAIRQNAELAVRSYFKELAKTRPSFSAVDYMDDGTAIALKVTLDEKDGSAVFDFEGTGGCTLSNLNAPEAIAKSALIYCIRVMIGSDMPLNSGVLEPIDVRIPRGSLLAPDLGVAINSGNTETSQRITDVIFRAFEACGASQGCMNMLGFIRENGNSYGETICGGSGAGPTFHGADAVQINMTNTRITDPEVLEKRQPVILQKFAIRPNSGGLGQFDGGNGVHREFEFLEPTTVSIIGERRVNPPYGMLGGGHGERGATYWLRRQSDGSFSRVKTKPSCTIPCKTGDIYIIHTPGGGGFGRISNKGKIVAKLEEKTFFPKANGSVNAWKSAQEASN